jgi:flagellum-specific peptidoglycan hydrolase FlgJ
MAWAVAPCTQGEQTMNYSLANLPTVSFQMPALGGNVMRPLAPEVSGGPGLAADRLTTTGATLAPGGADNDAGSPDPGAGRRGPIRQLQFDLKQLGYFNGYQPTGGYYHVTRDAVRRFQVDQGLPATGKADAATQSALTSTLGSPAATQGHRIAVTPAARPTPPAVTTQPTVPVPSPAPQIAPAPSSAPRIAPVPRPAPQSAPSAADTARLAAISHADLAHLGRTDKPAFFETLRPAAEEVERRYGVPAAVTMGQIAYETGYGAHVPGGNSYNLFGHKGVGPAGSVRAASYEAQGTRLEVSPFRRYHDFAEAMLDHGQVMSAGYYRRAMTTVANGNPDPTTFLRNIEGIYHQDGHRYTTDVMGIIRRYNLDRPTSA